MAPAKRVLVIDDDRAMCVTLRALLSQEGYRPVMVPDGEKAVRRAQRWHPDLIVLDLGLPGMDGWETLRRLRESPETAKVPVVILSANREPQDVVRAVQSGAEYYVGKPFRAEELCRSMRVALRKHDG